MTDNPVVEAPAPEASLFFDESTLLIAGSILLTIFVGGTFVLIYKAFDALGASVPQTVINEFSSQIVNVMTKAMAGVKTQVESTPTPVDDAFYAVAKIPVDFLIEEIKRRALTEENQAKLAAIITWDNANGKPLA